MLRKLPYISLLVFVLVSICFLTFQITYTETNKTWEKSVDTMIATDAGQLTKPLFELVEIVEENSVYSGDEKTLSYGVMSGYISALPDRFSMFMDSENYDAYLSTSSMQNSVGIGVSTLYDETKDGIYIVDVYRTSPAEQSGLVPGDIITHVNSVSVKDVGYYSIMHILGGQDAGQTVSVTVKKHDGASQVVNLVIKAVSAENITGQKLKDEIGLVSIHRFSTGDDENFKTVLAQLIKSGCKKFVIDIRNNPGGDFTAIEEILDFILPEGPMFTVKDKSGTSNTVLSDSSRTPYPIAVIVNENTVCGAEIFASCMKNADNCTLVGVTTYGKASTQSVISNVTSVGGAVCLSTKKYVPASGEDFDNKGVSPVIEADLTVEAKSRFTTLSQDEDTQLLSAIEWLKNAKMTDIQD